MATGIGGAQQFGYGRPRGSVIGMKVVLADGSLIKAGGRVVKNVAGYDLCKLFTGSFGSLGIITEVNFKLRPRPAREATVIATGNVDEPLDECACHSRRAAFSCGGTRSYLRHLRTNSALRQTLLHCSFASPETKKASRFRLEQALALLKNADVVMNDDCRFGR